MSVLERSVRVLMIGRFYWPLGSFDSAGHLMQLSQDLHRFGHHVSVVTPRFASNTAERFQFREIDVFRPVRLFRSGWSMRGDRTPARYVRQLRQWMIDHAKSYDLIYCEGLREEAIAGVEAGHSLGIPTVVRATGPRIGSQPTQHAQSRMGRRCLQAGQSADALVMSCAADQRDWISSGGSPDNIHRIDIGVGAALHSSRNDETGATPELADQAQLRRALAGINGDMFVPDQRVIVLSVERMHPESGLMKLVESAYSLSEKIPNLNYWLVGDGPSRDVIYTQLRSDGLRQVTAMPGSFGLQDDVYVAADVLVHVGEEGYDHQIPTAVSAGIPLVLADTPAARDFFGVSGEQIREQLVEKKTANSPHRADSEDDTAGLINWFLPERPRTLRLALQRVTEDLSASRERASKLMRQMQLKRPRRSSVEHYARLFKQLTDSRRESPEASAETPR